LIDSSTYKAFGHGDHAPWLTMHTVGNRPRNHAIYASLEELFLLTPPYPAANLEPYYTGWNHTMNRPGGETPAAGSDRDVYFSRAMMYGSVLSGGLAGHVHGTAAYDMTSTGEPAGWRPHVWTALHYASGAQMQHLKNFILSERARYQQLELAAADVSSRTTVSAQDEGLDGWTFMMRTPDRELALLYFENHAVSSKLAGFGAGNRYRWTWFNPRTGDWLAPLELAADGQGAIASPVLPEATPGASNDWAAKLVRVR